MADKAARLLRIYSRLRRGPVTIEIIKDWSSMAGIAVSERQLYRDLKEIESSISLEGEKVVVYEGEKNRKVWKIEYKESEQQLSLFDINSFFLFKNFAPLTLAAARKTSLEKFEGKFYSGSSNSGFEKNILAISAAIKNSHFYEYPYLYSEHQLLEQCIWAIQNQRKVYLKHIRYDHTSLAASTRFPITLLPLLILHHRGCIHLCGLNEENKKLMILALEQLHECEWSNDMFDASLILTVMEAQLSRRFGITENIDEKVYDVEIEFSSLTGSFVKNHFWHTSQRFEKRENGNWIMHLHCGINRELIGWIFQWMSNAKVVEPALLKDLVEQKLQATISLYSSEDSLASNNSFRSA